VTLEEEAVWLRAEHARLTTALAAALERIAALEAQLAKLRGTKDPPAFAKAAAPPKGPKVRKRRAPEHNKARRREPPTAVVRHALDHCPDCGYRH